MQYNTIQYNAIHIYPVIRTAGRRSTGTTTSSPTGAGLSSLTRCPTVSGLTSVALSSPGDELFSRFCRAKSSSRFFIIHVSFLTFTCQVSTTIQCFPRNWKKSVMIKRKEKFHLIDRYCNILWFGMILTAQNCFQSCCWSEIFSQDWNILSFQA